MAKLKFIQTEEYYLMVEEDKTLYEDLILRNWYWNSKEEELNLFQNAQPLYHYNNYYKVIAHLPKNNSPILKGVDLLPELPNNSIKEHDVIITSKGRESVIHVYPNDAAYEVEINNETHTFTASEIPSNEEDVEQLAKKCFEEMKILNPKGGLESFIRMAVIYGYKAAKQSEKKYSEQDMRNCYVAGSYVGDDPNENFEDFLKSLSTTKEPIDFEVEMEKETFYTDDGLDYKSKMQPKVIKGVLQGRWIFK